MNKPVLTALCVLQLLLCHGTASHAQATNVWTQMANRPGAARTCAASFSIGNKGYIGTGTNGSSGFFADFWQYDPVSNVWTQKANFGGGGRIYAIGFSVGNKGYMGMGTPANTTLGSQYDLWEYDTTANNWTQKANLPSYGRSCAVAFSIGNKGYVGTGSNNVSYNDFWEYDPATNNWQSRANFPGSPRYAAVGFSIGNKGYIGTGFASVTGYSTDFYQYNPATNTWAQKANVGGPGRSFASAFTIGLKGYIGIGEVAGGNGLTADFWEYDTVANNWTQRANYGAGAGHTGSSFAMGNKGYIGDAGSINQYWEYAPPRSIQTSPIAGSPFCITDTLMIPFTLVGPFATGNIFTAQLSDSTGSFATPVTLGTLAGTNAGTITALIPAGTANGSHYRIRVNASNPVLIGTDNYTDLIIHSPMPPSLFITASQVTICPGAQVVFTANPTLGGTAPQYQWFKNSIAIPLATSGTYTSSTIANNDTFSCFLTSNGRCISTATAWSNKIVMHFGTLIVPSISITTMLNPACAAAADSFYTTVTNGGTAPSFQWKRNGVNVGMNTPILGLIVNNGDVITCVVTSNAQCVTTTTATSNALTMQVSPPNLLITAAGGTGFCQGDSLRLSADSITTGLSYQWQVNGNNIPGATAKSYYASYPGVFNVVLNQGNCTASSNGVNVTVYPAPVPLITQPGPAQMSTFGYATYQWYLGSMPITGATNNTYTATRDGSYYVVVTDGNGCTGKSAVMVLTHVGVAGVHQNAISVLPNPAVDFIEIKGVDKGDLFITDLSGRIILQRGITQACMVEIKSLATGMYLLKITNETGQIYSGKLIKK